MHRLAPLLLSALLHAASAAHAQSVSITVGSVTGVPGNEVTVPVRLDPLDFMVLGARNDILINALTPVRQSGDGSLDCSANTALDPLLPPTFTCIEWTGQQCSRLRAIIFRPVNSEVLPPGVLYSCTFAIDPAAPPGAMIPLDIRSAVASDFTGRILPTKGESGAITVEAPTPTITPSGTPTASPSPTRPPTDTVTPTSTPLTPVPTPTSTPTPAIAIRVTGGTARPGTGVSLSVDLTDRTGQVSDALFDLLLPEAVFVLGPLGTACTIDLRLPTHVLTVSTVVDPPAPVDSRRLRVVVSDTLPPPDLLGTGPLLRCVLPVREEAPAGRFVITLERVFAGDVEGRLLLGAAGIDGDVVIDPDAPLPTATATATRTVSFTATRTAIPIPTETGTETASATPTPTAQATRTPSSGPPTCIGDCNGNGAISINELIRSVSIAVGNTPVSDCPPVDSDSDGVVTVSEIIAAVGNALGGCPAAPASLSHRR